ncbi:MAG TPA: APC family permease [Solirubrobacteraceae bacterium]|jgi:amino acid transporter|nr:APC family permease [Solirubrobacteraceae bacterium]
MATEAAAETVAVSGSAASSEIVHKGLKRDAIGYISNVVIGVASTAPAYSLAATLGFIVADPGVGVHAPAVLLVSFIPMLLVASAYKYLNRADPDAGTTFAWTTRAFGPSFGWLNGWAIFLADVLVMASLSAIAAIYTFKLFGFTELGESKAAEVIAAILWIVLMTWICYRGIELSARVQRYLLTFEVIALVIFAIVALVKVYTGHPSGAIQPEASWFNPFDMNFKDLLVALLLGIFLYWGWDSGVSVNEESEDPNEGPGRAAVVSTVLLVVIYLVVSSGAQAFHGVGFISNEQNSEDVINALGKPVFGGGVVGWVLVHALILCVLTSASASTQTTILPTARTTLSMAHWKSIPGVFGTVHKRYLTPTASTLGFGAISIAITVPLLLLSTSVLEDSLIALGIPVCLYYGTTGFACAAYYRHELTKSVRNFLLLGVGPVVGGLIFYGIGVYAIYFYGKAENAENQSLAGITLPLWFGVGGMILGAILMLISRPYFREFFSRKRETCPKGMLGQPVERAPLHL